MKNRIALFFLLLLINCQLSAFAQTVAPNSYLDNAGVHVVSAPAQSIYPTVPLVNQLRIYATSGQPFSNTAFTTAGAPNPQSSLYIGGRADGNQCTFQQTNGSYQIYGVPETTYTPSGLTSSTRYDLYMKNIAGTITISVSAWSGTATPPTRGTDSFNRSTKSGDLTSLLIGTFLANTAITVSLFTSVSDNVWFAATPAGTVIDWWQPSSSISVPCGYALCNGASAVWQTGSLAGTTFTLPNEIGMYSMGGDLLSGTSTANASGFGSQTAQTTYGAISHTHSVTLPYPGAIGANALAGPAYYGTYTTSSASNAPEAVVHCRIMKL